MNKTHYLGLLGTEPIAIRLAWSDAATESCYPLLAKQEPHLLVQRREAHRGKLKSAAKEIVPFAEIKHRKTLGLEMGMARLLTEYLSAKIPPDSLQDILGHARPESLHVSRVQLNDTQTAIARTHIDVAYPPEQPRGPARQINLIL